MSESSPYEYKPITNEDVAVLKKHYSGEIMHEQVRVGSKGYMLLAYFKKHAAGIKYMPLRDTDTFVVSYPRSGTTWTQELVWLIGNNLDFDKAKSIPLTERYPFLEYYMFMIPILNQIKKEDTENKKILEFYSKPAAEVLADTPSPRFIKTHLPLSLLPTGTLETAKVVYVARDPRDIVVSLYHFLKTFEEFGLQSDFKEFYYEVFSKDLAVWSPFFEHIKEAWELRDHPNLLYIRYEELSKDLKGTAKRVSSFLGKQYTDEQLDQLCDHLTFDNFQKNNAIDLKDMKKIGFMQDSKNNFVRKGKVGGWREYFDPAMEQHAAKWMNENLLGTGITFEE